jgi:hypothetical protein
MVGSRQTRGAAYVILMPVVMFRLQLSKQDAQLFFKLMWSLQHFVNLKLEILPEVKKLKEYQEIPLAEKVSVRDALYDNIELVDTYRAENHQGFSEGELEIIMSCKKCQHGNFFIERLLKKYAVFIGGEEVYGVLALNESFEDVLPYVSLPYYAETVLLPFKGQIIYDGLLVGYSVTFGSGIMFDLKEIYMAAKRNGKIILSFDPKVQAKKSAKEKRPIKDWGPTIDEISKRAKVLRSSSGAPAIHSPAFSLAKSSKNLQN